MVLQILTYTHHITTMLFGIFLSAFFLGVKQDKKNILQLLSLAVVSGILYVLCVLLFGTETVDPCEGNGGQTSALNFYGSSFIADETGELISEASRDQEEILYSEFDLAELAQKRLEWGLFRDRRPEMYGIIAGKKLLILTLQFK